MSTGFLKLQRTPEVFELLKDPKAFALLTLIALRARRTGEFNLHSLQVGQALIGDHASCGLTQQQYRSAKERLARWGLATFRATKRGTIATLPDTRIYDINEDARHQADNKLPTNSQQAANRLTTTNKNGKNGRRKEDHGAVVVGDQGNRGSGGPSRSPAYRRDYQAGDSEYGQAIEA